MVSRWSRKREEIMKDAAVAHRKLLSKGRKLKKHAEPHRELLCEFRNKAHRIGFEWLWLKARNIHR